MLGCQSIQIEIPDMLGCQSIQIEIYLICWGVYTDRDIPDMLGCIYR